ncbi:MAG: quinolinate synthase NadA, partial [Deltaproteobacteria bacterium]|nr:quinolinate synthase NadA [Deltaproteobacteria bacterium]
MVQPSLSPASPGTFPSLVIRANLLEPRGAFAEAQAEYLEPDPATVARLRELLAAHGAGVVAHFYMGPELQGTLAACDWPHIHIADSLLMASRAVEMAQAGARAIVVLGVDFMSENVRAILDGSGFSHVPVYRVDTRAIGCSLAESAEAPAYGAYLTRAARHPRSLHVVYVNTSLRVKAKAQALLPTITCTSSNVVSMVLGAAAALPGVQVWFGPDTYMGKNLHGMFSSLAELGDDTVRSLHPAHDAASVRRLVERFHYFGQGICVVHHLFADQVVERTRHDYPDAMITAHLEVPGEMFGLGLERQRQGLGVVGSTSNILGFINSKVDEALGRSDRGRLQFILGTESGMITAIARSVQEKLRAHDGHELAVEIVFPVAGEALAPGDATLPVVPGVAAGEGCSTAGGCATCPYMKMNSLDALLALLERLGTAPPDELA